MNWADIVNELFEKKCISFLSYEIFHMMSKKLGDESAFLLMIANHELENGHSCFLPEEIADRSIEEYFVVSLENGFVFPPLEKIRGCLNNISNFDNSTFVFERGKFFVRRVYNYEKFVVERLKELAKSKETTEEDFDENLSFWQNIAVKMALSNRLLIISGGPGTGKTTTIKSIIRCLIKRDKNCKIVITAPTGKAVSRISESFEESEFENVKKPITLHRLLGSDRLSMKFYYSEKNRLPYDVVIVDEMSMVGLEMMYNLLKALKDEAKLILLGDKDQLASVEAGAVMGEICSYHEKEKFKDINVFSRDYGKYLGLKGDFLTDDSNDVVDSVVELRENFRFDKDSGVGVFAEAIRNNDFEKINDIVSGKIKLNGLNFLENIDERLLGKIVGDYISCLNGGVPADYLNKVKVLTPLKVSLLGSDKLNSYIEDRIKRKLYTFDKWYPGRQILVRVNDYFNNLFNGDIGVFFDGNVVFPKGGGENIVIKPELLPLHEPAFAMTVHKSQGSEFEKVYFIFGKDDLPILTKELVYTAITRAKKEVCLIGSKSLLLKVLKRRTVRKSAISDMLYE